MLSKAQITLALIEKLPGDDKPSLDEALSWWWQNPKEDSGLRLSMDGYFMFNLHEIESHKFEVPPSTPLIPNQLLALDRHMTCPYYIQLGKKPVLIFYGSKEATMFALYGDIQKFLRGISRN